VLADDDYKTKARVCGEILQRNFFTGCLPTKPENLSSNALN
jgi:hypothetical protein